MNLRSWAAAIALASSISLCTHTSDDIMRELDLLEEQVIMQQPIIVPPTPEYIIWMRRIANPFVQPYFYMKNKVCEWYDHTACTNKVLGCFVTVIHLREHE